MGESVSPVQRKKCSHVHAPAPAPRGLTGNGRGRPRDDDLRGRSLNRHQVTRFGSLRCMPQAAKSVSEHAFWGTRLASHTRRPPSPCAAVDSGLASVPGFPELRRGPGRAQARGWLRPGGRAQRRQTRRASGFSAMVVIIIIRDHRSFFK